MRIDPAMSGQFLHFLGLAYLMAGKYETAAALLRQRIILVPEHGFFPRHSHFGARPSWRDRRRAAGVGGTDGRSIRNIRSPLMSAASPSSEPEDVERIAEGLRKAGVLS